MEKDYLNYRSYHNQRLKSIVNLYEEEWRAKYFQFIKNHKDKLYWPYLSANMNITMEMVDKTVDSLPWDFIYLHDNPNFDMWIVYKYLGYNWNWVQLYAQCKFTRDDLDYLLKNGKVIYWNILTMNPNTNLKFIEDNLDLYWSWNYLSENINFKFWIVDKYPDKDWNWCIISRLENIPFNFFMRYSGDFKAYKDNISSNLPIEDIIDSIKRGENIEWVWGGISRNKSLRMGHVLSNLDKNLDFMEISKNPGIKMDDIENNRDLDWNWWHISMNPNFTNVDIEKYWDSNLNWHFLSNKEGVPLELLKKDENLDWFNIARNHKLTIEFIKTNNILNDIDYNGKKIYRKCYNKKLWYWFLISLNKSITINNIENNMDLRWDWNYLSQNPNMTMGIVEEYDNIPWDIEGLSQNPNLYISYVENRKHYFWDWKEISFNKFEIDRLNYMVDKYKKYMMAFRIQQYWFNNRIDPKFIICQKKLNKDYNQYND